LVSYRTLHTLSLPRISLGMAARSMSYTKSTRSALAFLGSWYSPPEA
jgi:hypothetical protein